MFAEEGICELCGKHYIKKLVTKSFALLSV